jgi:hypothetical protein
LRIGSLSPTGGNGSDHSDDTGKKTDIGLLREVASLLRKMKVDKLSSKHNYHSFFDHTDINEKVGVNRRCIPRRSLILRDECD